MAQHETTQIPQRGATQEGTVVGRPNFDLALLDDRISAGETATLSAVLVNDARVFRGGDPRDEAAVTTAYNVSIRPRTEASSNRLAAGLTFETRRVPLGAVPPDSPSRRGASRSARCRRASPTRYR